MATLKNMTRVGADVRQIARLLQAKAPENHMLAYITPEEAQLLRDRGGSGMPDPETGVPSFAPAYDYGSTENPVYDYGDVRSEPAPQIYSQPVASVEAQAPVQEDVSVVPQNISTWVKVVVLTVCSQAHMIFSQVKHLFSHSQKDKVSKQTLIVCIQHHSFKQLLVFLNLHHLKLLKYLKLLEKDTQTWQRI